MIRLTEEMCQLINNARANGNPCIVATASPDGTPNAGYIGTVLALDEATFAYRSADSSAAISSPVSRQHRELVYGLHTSLFRPFSAHELVSTSARGWLFQTQKPLPKSV